MPAEPRRGAYALLATLDEVSATLARVSGDQWRRTCAAEGWPVGLVGLHIALGVERLCGWIEGALAGRTPPDFSWAETDALNAAVARAGLLPSSAFVLAGLSAGRERLRALLESASDADMDRAALSYEGKPISLRVVMRNITRDVTDHLMSMRGALA